MRCGVPSASRTRSAVFTVPVLIWMRRIFPPPQERRPGLSATGSSPCMTLIPAKAALFRAPLLFHVQESSLSSNLCRVETMLLSSSVLSEFSAIARGRFSQSDSVLMNVRSVACIWLCPFCAAVVPRCAYIANFQRKTEPPFDKFTNRSYRSRYPLRHTYSIAASPWHMFRPTTALPVSTGSRSHAVTGLRSLNKRLPIPAAGISRFGHARRAAAARRSAAAAKINAASAARTPSARTAASVFRALSAEHRVRP